MGRFDDALSREDARQLHAYIVHAAWEAYSDQSSASQAQ